MLSKLNTSLKGFRGILTILSTLFITYLDVFFTNITHVTLPQLKAAAIMALPISIKIFWTDARPRILNWIADRVTK